MAVAYKRGQLGLPKVDGTLRKWTAEEEALLKRLPDRIVAQRTGRTLAAVVGRRFDLGLQGAPPPHRAGDSRVYTQVKEPPLTWRTVACSKGPTDRIVSVLLDRRQTGC